MSTIFPNGTNYYPCLPNGTGYYPGSSALINNTWQTTSATMNPWPYWVNAQMTGGTTVIQLQTTGTNVWVNWNAGYSPPISSGLPPVSPTPAMSAREALIRQNRQKARTLRRKQAERRAEFLLLENLTDVQREEWVAEKAFHVETPDGRRRYRIKLGLAGNVSLVKCEGDAPRSKYGHPLRAGNRFCAHVYHPDGPIPDADNCLAQALLLQSPGGEEEFLAMANVS